MDGKPCDLNALANFAAGFGDAITFGATNWIRDKIDANGVVDQNSAAYFGGTVTGIVVSAILSDGLTAEASEASQGARAGETAATQAGREAHEAYSAARQAEGFTTNRAIPGTRLRPDAIDPVKGIIRELKPNNPAAIRRGLQQLKVYKEAAERAYPGTKFTTFLDTY